MSEYPFFDEHGEVICQICGKGVKQLGSFHLTKLHNMTLSEYREKFPDYPISAKKGIFPTKPKPEYDPGGLAPKKDSPVIETLDEITDDTFGNINSEPLVELMNDKEEIQKITISDGKIQTTKIKPKTSSDGAGKDKIVSYLKTIFYDVVNNYIIEKFNVASGFLEYRFVTDISVPSRKLDFEFPNSFWHNHDPLFSINRERYLQVDGWTIITISSRVPNVIDVEKAVKKLFSSEQ